MSHIQGIPYKSPTELLSATDQLTSDRKRGGSENTLLQLLLSFLFVYRHLHVYSLFTIGYNCVVSLLNLFNEENWVLGGIQNRIQKRHWQYPFQKRWLN